MAKRRPRRIVVDASVARASGPPDATHPTGQQCRDCLSQMLSICHHVVMTEAIHDEWQLHRSGFARRWLTAMYSRRKVARIEVPEDAALRRAVGQARDRPADSAAMLKDCHLVEAALATDRLIVSLDEAARGLFADLSLHHDLASRVVWVNPALPDERTGDWLRAGARDEGERTLAATRRQRQAAQAPGTT